MDAVPSDPTAGEKPPTEPEDALGFLLRWIPGVIPDGMDDDLGSLIREHIAYERRAGMDFLAHEMSALKRIIYSPSTDSADAMTVAKALDRISDKGA